MDTFKAVALAILLALIGEPARAESFPAGDVFRPLVADPAEPRFFVSVLSVERSSDKLTVGSIGGGVNFGLYRWPGERADEGWQVGIFGSITSQFDLGSSSDDLINADYRVGFPLSYKRGDFSGRARIFHQSSHLGDEVILNGSAPERINLSYEAVDFLLAWQRGNWRPYGGAYYMLRGDSEGLKKSGLQAGIHYARSTPVLFGGRLVGGLDIKWFEGTDWRAGISGKVGLEFGRPGPERRGITLLLEAYDGPAPFGQYFRHNISYYGAGVQFDL
jgi:hypothetical protein